MPDSSNTLRNTIIGTVVGGLILSLILWLAGFLPQVWTWFVKVIVAIWNGVTTDISTPIWVLSVLFLLALPVLWRFGLKIISLIVPTKIEASITSTAVDGHPVIQSNGPQLTESELLVLRALAAEDGGSAHVDTVVNRIGQNQLRSEQALDSLINKNLVGYSLNYVYGNSYYLSDRGRDLVIELGYA